MQLQLDSKSNFQIVALQVTNRCDNFSFAQMFIIFFDVEFELELTAEQDA